jgi:gliding motility-associated-like protein
MNLKKLLSKTLLAFLFSFICNVSFAHSGGVWIANDGCGHWYAIVFHYHGGSSASSASPTASAGLYFDYDQNGFFDVDGAKLAYNSVPGRQTSTGEFTRFTDYIVFAPVPANMTAHTFANDGGIQTQVLNWFNTNKNFGKNYSLSVATDAGTYSSVWYEALICPIQPLSPGIYKASTSTSSDVETPIGSGYSNPFTLTYTPSNFTVPNTVVGQLGYTLDINTTLTQTCVAEYGWIYSNTAATPTVADAGVVKTVVSSTLSDYNNQALNLNINVPVGDITQTYYIRSYYKQTVNGQDYYVYSAVTSVVPVPPPVISQQAGDKDICNGTNTSLAITATIGQGTISYKWQVNTGSSYQDITDNAIYSGAATATLSITAATTALSGYKYRCILTSSVNTTVTTTSAESLLTVRLTAVPGVSAVTYTLGDTPAPLENAVTATGNLLWYTGATGGPGSATAPAVSTAASGSQDYWVTQTANTCESDRAKITVVVKKNIIAIGQPANITITYGDALNLPATVAVVYNNTTTESRPVTWNTSAYTGKAGDFTISGVITLATGTSNTTAITPAVSVRVNKKPVTVVLQGYVTKTYDANTQASVATGNYRLTGIITGDQLTITTAPATGTYDNANAGTGKTVTVTGIVVGGTDINNYSLASASTSAPVGIINQAVITVTAENKSKFAGNANPALTVTYSGFAGTEGEAVITTKATPSTTATTTAVGTYDITASGAVASNYSFLYVKGTLTVLAGVTSNETVTAATLYENQVAGTLAGTLGSVSENPVATFIYSLVAGTGDTDNSLFSISGNQLKTAASLNYEQKSSYSVRVKSLTQYGATLEKVFTINISDVNEIPTLNQPADKGLCYTATAQTVALSGITAGPETSQTTTLSVTSTNSALFDQLAVTGTGTTGQVSFTVKAGASGTASVTVKLKDNGGTANGGVDEISRTFTVTVNPFPVFTITSSKGNTISLGTSTQLTVAGTNMGSIVWSPSAGIDFPLSFTPNARPLQNTTYTATVSSSANCVTTGQVTIAVKDDYTVIAPKVIVTPNGDGINDRFVIDNIDAYPNNLLQVFDRTGKVVYEQRNYHNEWNGLIRNRAFINDTYFYVLTVNGQLLKKGSVTIVK